MDSRTCIVILITPQSKSPLEKGYNTHSNYKTFCILTPSLTFEINGMAIDKIYG